MRILANWIWPTIVVSWRALRKKLLKYYINHDKELFTKLQATQPYLQKTQANKRNFD